MAFRSVRSRKYLHRCFVDLYRTLSIDHWVNLDESRQRIGDIESSESLTTRFGTFRSGGHGSSIALTGFSVFGRGHSFFLFAFLRWTSGLTLLLFPVVNEANTLRFLITFETFFYLTQLLPTRAIPHHALATRCPTHVAFSIITRRWHIYNWEEDFGDLWSIK